jgi:hypothetical protein
VRHAALLIFVGATVCLLACVAVCVRYIVTAPADDRADLIGPNVGMIAIAILIMAPAVLLAIPVRMGMKGARWPLSVVGALYLIVGVMTVGGGVPLAIVFIVYNLIWLIVMWVNPQPLRKNTAD